ncbi:nineteen complex-related protein 2-domain-containing protein [Zychaea mexicana]|uniref:nineteen complex-related protein 2-domain-containing protein n=1 Tax=Zychaea mexicana TaxID=64656 RepID=UPI0022FEFB3A|nr:nineteen complex-related protein 2-domain-containing protein [Zychaea mexicana]KAI9489329.1 nineteen complex-related protein 2-domain-containing protein [Zychaea mexicana]
MFKKSSRAKNIRRKIETSDNEEEQNAEIVTTTVINRTKLEKKKKKKEPKQSLGLSFDQEEGDTDTFTVKKSKASLRLAAARKSASESTTITEQTTTTSSAYTNELLEALRKDTPSTPAALKGTSLTENQLANDDDSLLAEKFPSLLKSDAGGSIPDARAIHAAKKKREQMRKGYVDPVEEDFVALDDKGGSRLVREEDEVGDDGEGEYEAYVGERLTLNKKAARKQEQERRAGVREMIEEAQDDDEDEQDIERWESELIRHGGVKPQRRKEPERDPYAPPPGYRPAEVPIESPIMSLDKAIENLNGTASGITNSVKDYETQLEQMQKNMEMLSTGEADLEKEIVRGSERYDYFQGLASYVNDLGEFLDAKFPELEALEKQAHDIIATKHDVVTKRRWQDDMDDLREFAKVPEQPSEAEAEAEEEEQQQQSEVDEFGRVRDLRDSASAQQRRRIERQQRIAQHEDLISIQQQGLWSDDELAEDWEARRDQKLDVIQNDNIPAILEDVSDEFGSIEMIKSKFEAWKTNFYEDYTKAFGSLSLPGAFEFYVRCELATWNPFTEPVDFDTMRWHSVLSQYGITDEHEDADTELLNKVVEKVLIKKIKSLLDTLNVASMKEMRYAAQAVEQVSYYVEKHERPFMDLMSAIESAIDKQLKPYADLIDTITVIEPNSEAKERVVWRLCKYLKTLHVWRRYLPKDTLKSLGTVVMNRMVAPLLRPDNGNDGELQREALQLLARLE